MKRKFTLRFKDWRIRTKLLVIMLILSWIPLLVILVINVSNQIKYSKVEIENHILGLVTGSVDQLKDNTIHFIDDNHDDLQHLADNETILELLRTAPQMPIQTSGEPGQAPQQPGADAGQLPPPPGGEGTQQPPRPSEGNGQQPSAAGLQDEDFMELSSEVNQYLLEFSQSHSGVEDISLTGPNGITIASSTIETIGMNNMMRGDVTSALAGTPYTESIHLSPVDNAPGFFISTPVIDNGNVIGALSARLNADFIVTALSQRENEYETYFIANTYGVIMVHSDPNSEWLYKSLKPLDEASQQIIEENHLMGNYDQPLTEIPAAAPLGEALTEAAEQSTNGILEYCHFESISQPYEEHCRSGELHTVAYEVVNDPISDKVLFVIFVDVPEHIFTGPVEQQIYISIIGSILMAIVLILTSILMAQSIARPIRTIAESAETVEQDQPFDPETLKDISDSMDEIGAFARVFSKMAKVVQEREQKLKKTVAKLQIKIDQVKREKDAREIMDGEFFQDLQSRAKELRGRKDNKASGESQESKPED